MVEASKKRGALGELPEEPPIPKGIPDKVKERILKPRVPPRPWLLLAGFIII